MPSIKDHRKYKNLYLSRYGDRWVDKLKPSSSMSKLGGTVQYFSIFGKNPISKNLEIGPTIFDKRLLLKSPFYRVSDRNVRNGKTPVIGLASPLPELQLMHAPPHSLAVSKRNSGKCMFPGGSRACPWGGFAIAYVRAPLLSIY